MKIIVTVVSSLLLASCSTVGGDEPEMRFGEFSRQLSNFDEVMLERRPELQLNDGSSVQNCRDYLDLDSGVDVSESVENITRSADYRICDTLRALKSADPVSQPYRSNVAAGEVLRNRLDLRSFRSSLGPASSRYHTFAQIEEELPVRVEGDSVILESDDWYLHLEVVARADVNGDGNEDWLVWLTDEARSGNYRGYDVLVIDHVAREGLLEADSIGK